MAHLLTLDDNTYNGTTLISGGTLQLGDGGTTGSLATTSAITNNATLAFNRSNAVTQGTDFAAVIGGTGNVTQAGTGTTTFTGANTYTGTTTVSNGTLQLSRVTADNSAIPTDANIATTSDIVISGGNLVIAASEQIGDTGSINMSSGSFGFSGSGLTETIDKLTSSGGTFSTGANTLEVLGATVTWSGGTNTINTGGVVSDKHWIVTGGTNTVQQNGILRVQSGTGTTGLHFGGTASPTITVDKDATNPGVILLKQDVFVDASLTSGTAQILNGAGSGLSGQIDLNGGTRTFDISNGSASTDLLISTEIANGGLTKAGAGTLTLTGNDTFTGATTINASGGTLEVGGTGSLSGSTSIAVNSGGTLLLSGTGGTDTKLNTSAAVTLNGGSLAVSDSIGGSLDQSVGALTLSANSIIDFGMFASGNTLRFANSVADWTGLTLNIYNWTAGLDHLFFGTNTSGLNNTGDGTGQLAHINFYTGSNTGLISLPTGFIGAGEIAPVPEPSAAGIALGLFGLIGWRERRKDRRALQDERSAALSKA